MSHLHTRLSVSHGKTVVVELDRIATVLLMTDADYDLYRQGKHMDYGNCHGGVTTYLPYKILVPSTGYWNLVIDVGEIGDEIRHSIAIVD